MFLFFFLQIETGPVTLEMTELTLKPLTTEMKEWFQEQMTEQTRETKQDMDSLTGVVMAESLAIQGAIGALHEAKQQGMLIDTTKSHCIGSFSYPWSVCTNTALPSFSS